jgi:flagellar basal body-associated protein FliL
MLDLLYKKGKKIMEIIILVSVLTTLGVVAIVGAIVVMFKKLNNKVDVDEFRNIYQELESVNNNQSLENSNIYSTIDSRCDKLYDYIANLAKSKKK